MVSTCVAATTGAQTAQTEKHEETSTRRALEARVRDAEAELARERERRADADRRASFAEARANTAAEGVGISGSSAAGGVAGGVAPGGGVPPKASVALMTAGPVYIYNYYSTPPPHLKAPLVVRFRSSHCIKAVHHTSDKIHIIFTFDTSRKHRV